MKIAKTASLIAAMAILTTGLSGCGFTGDIASLDMYAPSDGSQTDLVDARVRNFLLVERIDGQAVLLGTVVNSSVLNETSVSIQLVQADGSRMTLEYTIPASGKQDIGYNDGETVLVQLSESPGDLVSVFVSESAGPVTMQVPVVDGTLAEYRPFID